jgi:hypothetical protein
MVLLAGTRISPESLRIRSSRILRAPQCGFSALKSALQEFEAAAAHLCQLIKNCVLACFRLAARPLVAIPSFGLTYAVIDQNHRSSGLLCRSS